MFNNIRLYYSYSLIILFINICVYFLKANLRWFKNKNDDSIISCVTHTEDVQLWHTTDSSPYSIIPRDTISSSMNVSLQLFF